MRKEVLIAIVIGFILGLVITFGIWTANKALKEPKTEETAPIVQEEQIVTPTPEEFSLTILSPENNSIFSQENIEVSGKTSPLAILAIVYPEGEKILEANESGQFSTEIKLTGGENSIAVSAYNQNGDEIKQILTVVYSTAEI